MPFEPSKSQDRILFPFHLSLQVPSLGQISQFQGGNEVQRLTQPGSGMGVAILVLLQSTGKIRGGANVMSARCPTQNIDPSHRNSKNGGPRGI